MDKTVKFLVKEDGELVAEFWFFHDAAEYVEKFGGEIYKKVVTVKEYKMIGEGVWA